MNRNLVVFIDSILLSWILIYTMGKFCNKDIIRSKKNYYIGLGCLVIYLGLSYIFIQSFMKVILTFSILIMICHHLYKRNFLTSIVIAFSTLFINICSEAIYAIVIIVFAKIDINYIKNNIFGDLVSNVIITLINFGIIQFNFLVKPIRKFANNINFKLEPMIVIIVSLSLISISLLLYYLYFDVTLVTGVIMSLFLIMTFCCLTIFFLSEKSNKRKLEKEYYITLNSLSEYEKLYTYQRKLNHEFRNDLMVIRGMTNRKNKKLLQYIDEITDFKNNKSVTWIDTLRRIPEGGLLGILYYKLLSMEKENINVNFEIGENFKAKDYSTIEEKLKSKICKLLGIYLDNSIQAVKDIEQKNISISIDEENNFFIFTIKNNFIGDVDLDSIYKEGYTTNGKGRGYGLVIAKEIFEQDDRIFQRTLVSGNIFIQELKIENVKN